MKLLFKLFIRLMQILLEHTTASIYSEMCMCVCVGYVCVCVKFITIYMYVCMCAGCQRGEIMIILLRKHACNSSFVMTELILIYLNYFRVMLYYWQLSIVLL